MRWLPFIIVLYVLAGLQAAQLLSIPYRGALWPRVEWVMLAVVFYAMYASEDQAPLAGLAAGFAVDLVSSQEVMGTATIAMGLVSLGIVKVRLSVFREHAVSQIIMVIMAVLAYAFMVAVFHLMGPVVEPVPAGAVSTAGKPMGFFQYLWLMSGNAFYTGIIAPVLFWIFGKMRGIMGLGGYGPNAR